jgi:ubiquinone/menaquinone biosynthesis C-methylase UbiE
VSVTGAAFDGAAAAYDSVFTRTTIGRWLRARVWARLKPNFQPGMRVLELNCGTGEDALWLAQRGVHMLATDASEPMLAVARAKAQTTPFAARIAWQALDLAQLPAEFEDGFDGALSNFGGLNCLADRRGVAEFLARVVRPGGRVALVVMGPWCPWEVAWYAAHLRFGTAARRWRRGGVDAEVHGARVRVWYPTPGRLRREFAPWFRAAGLYGIGALLPPPYLGGLVERYPGLFARLGSAERRVAGAWPFNVLNDHYLLELERT